MVKRGVLDGGYGTAGQSPEGFEVNRLLVHLHQEGVEEVLVAEFIGGVLFDVRRHIVVNGFQRVGIRAIDIGKLGILLPKIRFENFSRGEEAQDSGVAFGNPQRFVLFSGVGQCGFEGQE